MNFKEPKNTQRIVEERMFRIMFGNLNPEYNIKILYLNKKCINTNKINCKCLGIFWAMISKSIDPKMQPITDNGVNSCKLPKDIWNISPKEENTRKFFSE